MDDSAEFDQDQSNSPPFDPKSTKDAKGPSVEEAEKLMEEL